MTKRDTDPTTLLWALTQKKNVMGAVMLRDMRTRFFDHGLGFLVVSLWPLGHIMIVLAINAFSGRSAPFGDSPIVFFATGLIPTLLFSYVSRFMALSLILNRPMMALPVVKVFDIMVARALLETIAAVLTLCGAIGLIWALGDDPFPHDTEQAVLAYLATLLLAVGVGSLAAVLVMFFPFFATIYAILMIIMYIASGTLFVAFSLPQQISYALSWNPVLECVEWMRTAYFDTYSDRLVSKTYILSFGFGSLFLGLFLERAFRRKMFES